MYYLEGTLTLVWELCFILGHHIDRVSPHEYCDYICIVTKEDVVLRKFMRLESLTPKNRNLFLPL